MATVIGILWKMLLSSWDNTRDRLQRCEDKERHFHEEMRKLSASVAKLEGEQEGERRGIETIVKAVTDEIRLSRLELLQSMENKNNNDNL